MAAASYVVRLSVGRFLRLVAFITTLSPYRLPRPRQTESPPNLAKFGAKPSSMDFFGGLSVLSAWGNAHAPTCHLICNMHTCTHTVGQPARFNEIGGRRGDIEMWSRHRKKKKEKKVFYYSRQFISGVWTVI